MNKLIKRFLNLICSFLTFCINKGQIYICYLESKRMYKIPSPLNKNSLETDFKKYKKNLRKYNFRPSKRDFLVFRNFFIEKGSDPSLIIPAYISNNFTTPVLNPIKDTKYFEDKNMFDKILPKSFLPVTYYRRINSKWYDINYNLINIHEVLKGLNDLGKEEKIIIKPSKDTSSGKGVMIFIRENNEFINPISYDKLTVEFINYFWGNNDIIIQEAIKQSDYLSLFCKTGVNTLRIVSYHSPIDGKCHIIWSGLKIAAAGQFVDNAHAGGIVVEIDKNGRLAKYGADQYGNKFFNFNGINFSDKIYTIPNYKLIIKFIERATKYLFPHRFISFDIAVDNNNLPKIIEFNLRGYSGWYCQFAGSPMYGEKTEEILSYVSQNRKKGLKFFYSIS